MEQVLPFLVFNIEVAEVEVQSIGTDWMNFDGSLCLDCGGKLVCMRFFIGLEHSLVRREVKGTSGRMQRDGCLDTLGRLTLVLDETDAACHSIEFVEILPL